MELKIVREKLLEPLQLIMGVVDTRTTLPILSHVLLRVDGQQLILTATDTEVELQSYGVLAEEVPAFSITLSGRILLDICRTLPEASLLRITFTEGRANLKAGRGQYAIPTLSPEKFPNHDLDVATVELQVSGEKIKKLIESTAFCMGQADVRYYLNGLLWHLQPNQLTTVASDGHRMALTREAIDWAQEGEQRVIVPRKGVAELLRLLSTDEIVTVKLSSNHLSVLSDSFVFTSKLIEGSYPEYQRFIPKQQQNQVIINRSGLKQLLTRISLYTNDKFRTVKCEFLTNLLKVSSFSPDAEHAEEEIEIDYQGPEATLGFNVSYLQDCLNAITMEQVMIRFSAGNQGVLLEPVEEGSQTIYVIMPICL